MIYNEVKIFLNYNPWTVLEFVFLIAITTDCIVSKAEDQYPKHLQYKHSLRHP